MKKLVLILSALLLVVFALILASSLLPQETLGLRDNPYLASVVIQLLIFAVPSLFWCRIRGRELTPRLRLNLFRPRQLLYLWHAAVFMTSLSVLLETVLYRLRPEGFVGSSLVEYASFAMNDRLFDGVYLVTAFAILPALTEEFLFRGIVIGEYESLSPTVAVTVSAALFAMSHFSWVRFPIYFTAGLVLGAVLYASRSVLAPILVHALYNTAVLFGEKAALGIADKQNVSSLLLIMILAAAMLVSGLLMCFEAQNIYKDYAEANLPSDYGRTGERRGAFSHIAQAYFSPTFLLLVLVFITAATALR